MLRCITVDVVATIMKPSPWLVFSDGKRIEGDPPFPAQHGIELDLLLASTANTVFANNNPVECYNLGRYLYQNGGDHEAEPWT